MFHRLQSDEIAYFSASCVRDFGSAGSRDNSLMRRLYSILWTRISIQSFLESGERVRSVLPNAIDFCRMDSWPCVFNLVV